MTFEVYRRLTWRGTQWFWRLKARNNRIVANGGEGFHNKGDVLKIIDKIAAIDTAQIKFLD